MKKTVSIKRVEIVNTPKEYIFPEDPIFYQVYNYRQVVGIYPNFGKKYERNPSGQLEEMISCDYNVYIGKDGQCNFFTLTEDELIEAVNKKPESSGYLVYEVCMIILKLNSFEDIHEDTFKKYYTKYFEILKLSL